MSHGASYSIGDFDIGCREIDVVGYERVSRADCRYARSGMKSGFSEIGQSLRVRCYLVAYALELTFAQSGEVFSFGPRGRFFIEVNRDAEFLPHPLAALSRKAYAIVHRHARDRDEGDHVGCAHAGMFARVTIEVYEFCGLARGSQSRCDYSFGRGDESDDRAIMVGVGLAIEQHGSGRGSYGCDYFSDDFRAAAFAEVRYAFDYVSHSLEKVSLTLCHSKIGVLPDIRSVKSQNDVVFRDARFDQFIGYTVLCAVSLNPDFILDDVDMNEYAVNSSGILPSDGHDQITIILTIEDRLVLNISVGISNADIL
jgi:hypothetical protein